MMVSVPRRIGLRKGFVVELMRNMHSEYFYEN